MQAITTADNGYMSVWLQAKVRERGLQLQPRLNAGHVRLYISAEPLPLTLPSQRVQVHRMCSTVKTRGF